MRQGSKCWQFEMTTVSTLHILLIPVTGGLGVGVLVTGCPPLSLLVPGVNIQQWLIDYDQKKGHLIMSFNWIPVITKIINCFLRNVEPCLVPVSGVGGVPEVTAVTASWQLGDSLPGLLGEDAGGRRRRVVAEAHAFLEADRLLAAPCLRNMFRNILQKNIHWKITLVVASWWLSCCSIAIILAFASVALTGPALTNQMRVLRILSNQSCQQVLITSVQCQAQITPIYNLIWPYDFDPEL